MSFLFKHSVFTHTNLFSSLKTTTKTLITAFTSTHSKYNQFEYEDDPLSKNYNENRRKRTGACKTFSPSEIKKLMPEPNIGAVLTKPLNIQLYEIPKPHELHSYEILIAMENTGICGSDFEYYKYGRISSFHLNSPMIIGHESGGRILAIGSDVKNMKIGDRVALEPGLPCGECAQCLSSVYNLCPNVAFLATPPVHGCMRRYIVRPSDWCYVLPSHLTSEDAALCEPLSVGIHATSANIANVQPNSNVVVFGAGPIGIITMLCAVYRGAANVVITDIVEDKLMTVKKYCEKNIPSDGMCKVSVLNTANILTLNELRDEICSLFSVEVETGFGADHTFECVGHSLVLNQAMAVTRTGGMCTVIGMAADPEMMIKIDNCNVMEKTLNGVLRYRDTYPTAIDMLANGTVGDVKELITLRLDAWDDVQLLDGFQKINENVKIMYKL